MRANAYTALVANRVVLVPYGRQHVPKYHAWMQDAHIRELTASEELSVEEEYEMQRKWQIDEDKLTFIILSRGEPCPPSSAPPVATLDSAEIPLLPMVGDVNLFLSDAATSSSPTPPSSPTPENEGTSGADSSVRPCKHEGELEIMIAEPAYRGNGYAAEVLDLFIAYVTGSISQAQIISLNKTVEQQQDGQGKEYMHSGLRDEPQQVQDDDDNDDYHSPLPLPRSALLARIGATNTRSIALFRKIGFEVVSEPNVFGEIEMRPVLR